MSGRPPGLGAVREGKEPPSLHSTRPVHGFVWLNRASPQAPFVSPQVWCVKSQECFSSPQPEKRLSLLPAVVALRLLIVPPLLLCNTPQRSFLPVLFAHDAWFIAFMVVLSLSNGYFVSLSMCLAPK